MKRTPAAIDPRILEACRVAVKNAGGPSLLAKKIGGITSQGIGRWKKGVPPKRVLAVEQASGISRYVLRPDVYGKPPKKLVTPEENGVPA